MKIKNALLVASAALMLTSCGGTTYTNEFGSSLTLNKNSFTLTTTIDEDNYKVKTVESGSAVKSEEKENYYTLTFSKISISGSCAGVLEEFAFTGKLMLYGLSNEQIEEVKNGKTVSITYEESKQFTRYATVNPEDNTFFLL